MIPSSTMWSTYFKIRSVLGGWLAAWLLCVQAVPTQAALDLELTKGRTRPIPLAVLPFTGTEQLALSQRPDRIIQANLARCGHFALQNLHGLRVGFSTRSDTRLFRQAGIDYLLGGSVRSQGKDSYQVQFTLLNVVQPVAHQMLARHFTVPATQLRSLSHQVSDQIHRQLVGTQGAFATRMTYVLVQPSNGARSNQVRYRLMVADADGYNPKPILSSPQPIMSPAWSPDGRQLAYVSFEGNTPHIYLQDIRTGARQRVGDYPGINGAPAFSPDGRKLAMALSRGAPVPKIYIMDLVTGKLRQLSFGRSIDTEPIFSPDGRSLVFSSNRGGSSPQIWQLKLANGQLKRLTFTGDYNASPSLTPDGKRLTCLTRDKTGYHIALLDLISGAFTSLTSGDSEDEASPHFAPDGYTIVYESRLPDSSRAEERSTTLKLVSIDGRVHRVFPTPLGSAQSPAWSP